MKLAWAVLWRVFVLQYLTAVTFLLAARNSPLLYDQSMMIWKPSVLWAMFAVLLLLGQLSLRNGLLYLLWGKQLEQPPVFWRQLSFSVAVLYLVLASLNIVAGKLAPSDLWLYLKTFAPFIALAVFSGTVPAWLAARSNPSLSTDAGEEAARAG